MTKSKFQVPKWAATPAHCNRFGKLRVLEAQEVVQQLPIGQKACYLLGRNEDAVDFSVPHASVSRVHAALVHSKQQQLTLMDLQSAQGTFLNGQEITPKEPVELKNGDRFRFGESKREYQVVGLDQEENNSSSNHDQCKQPHQEQHNTRSEWDERTLADMLPKAFGATAGNGASQISKPPSTKQSDRERRQAEIAAMTAAMMAGPAGSQRQDSESSQEPYDEDDNEQQPSDKQNSKRSQQQHEESSGESDQEDVAADDVATRYNIPMAQEVTFSSHNKAISCIAVDPPGARVATGSMDYHTKLWDFAGMARQVRPFRDIEVEDGHPVVALSYSPSGDRFLAATASSQPKVLTREGVEELHFTKGDMYVVDMVNTKGHTHAVTGGCWHPRRRDQVISSSLDGTVRIWQLNGKLAFQKLLNDSVIKFKSRKGKRCGVTACTFDLDGQVIAGGTNDGQVQLFDPRKLYAGPCLKIPDAHAEGSDLGVSCVRFAPNNKLVASRACSDDTVKLWDVRKPKNPLKVFSNLDGVFGTCNVAFNATGTCLVAGTSVQKGKGLHGQVLFFDTMTPNLVQPIGTIAMQQDESAVCVEWHHGINQLFVGSSTSACRVYYDPRKSTKGVLLSATKKLKPQQVDFGVRIESEGQVYNPHALPMYRDELSRKRKYHKIRSDPKASKIPEKPITGPGMGGRISGSTTFTQYFMSSHIKKTFREEDPREALLKYAKTARDDPQFLGAAYASTQPQEKLDKRYQLAEQTLEQEKAAKEEEERRLLQL